LSIGISFAALSGGGHNWATVLGLGFYGIVSGAVFVLFTLLHCRREVLSPKIGALYGALVGALSLPLLLGFGIFSLAIVGVDAMLGYFVSLLFLSLEKKLR
jgi:hypothetical protein